MMSTVIAQVTDIGSDVVAWALASIKWIVQQFNDRNYGAGVAGIIMVLVYVFNRYFVKSIKPSLLPWVSVAIGVLTSIATKLAGLAVGSNTVDWFSAIGMGFVAGATASGLWSLLGKHVVSVLQKKFGDGAAGEKAK
jgi:drug/metabolite transporter (DMT)-like permease